MNRFNRLVCVLAALLLAAAAHAQGGAPANAPPQGFTTTAKPTENDPVSAQREHELALQLRCLVCQNQSIAESNADLAVDLRRQVREQIAAGRSDSQIIDFMTQRYGDFVLYSPPLKGTTLLLWFGPFALLLVGALVAWRVVAARKAVVAPAPLSDEERARAAAMLAGERNT
ncbi:MAG: cytochrome c-type biogenesis protein CcmH [Betaproteobacteria bacterium]